MAATASAAGGKIGFGFNARDINGFPTSSDTFTAPTTPRQVSLTPRPAFAA
jgi:hypothetical protein